MIITTDFDTILKIWQNDLWPSRQSAIETHSAMLLNETMDIENFKFHASYFLYIYKNQIAGCNSGHLCSDNSYRSRGLFVYPNFRGKGLGVKLLKETIKQGKKENASLIWSYPRHTSWTTYEQAGFKLCSDWEKSEMSVNAYCKLNLY